MHDPVKLMKPLKDLVRETGQFILESRKSFKMEDVEKKGFNDLVSHVDKEAEAKIVHGCREILPESGFITEEDTVQDDRKKYTWVIDPLDGTTNFIHGLPAYCVSVALLEGDNLLLGAVYEPNRDELFHAIHGQGAFCNDDPIHVSNKETLGESLLATGFPYYDFGKMDTYLAILNDFMQSTHGLRRIGSAALDLVYVACGRFEGFFEYNLNAWDVAGGAIIVREAGGRVCDFQGGDNFLFGRELIAAPEKISTAMQETIRNRWN